jgi:replicative DNA helicase
MFDGTLKSVEDVTAGDLLMGPDSTSRTVLSTTAGVGQLYKIKQNKGVDYVVNDEHIVVLKRSKNEGTFKHGEVRCVKARELYDNQKTISSRWKGFSVAVDFVESPLPLDPYLLGVWLGDGSSSSPMISKPDIEMYEEVKAIAEKKGWTVVTRDTQERCLTYYVKSTWRDEFSMLNILRSIDVLRNKHIPHLYLANSRQNRLRLLAGLLDTDGYYAQGQYEIVQKVERLARDIKFLADTLGFRTSIGEKVVNGTTYYRVIITGDLLDIPLVIPRKQANRNCEIRDCSMTGFSVEDIGIGEYFGFELSGDCLYLLEDMTVTHNTSLMMHFSRVAAQMWSEEKVKTTFPPIVISAEMAIEEIMLREMSHHIPVDSIELERAQYTDWDRVHAAIDEFSELRPIIYVGHSLAGARKRPRISVENIQLCLDVLTDKYGMSPALLSIDYAQRLKLDKVTRDRRLEVSEIVESVKDMALRFAVPTNLGSQVGRQVDERKPPVPDLSDAKETANLEETADSMIATMRPIKYWKEGEIITGTTLPCRPELFFISILKQRQGTSGTGIWVWFDMAISRIADLETQRVDLNDF